MEENEIGQLGSQEYMLFVFLIAIFLFLIALVGVLKSRFTESTNKIVWLIVVFIPVIGPLLYFFIGRKQKELPNN